MVSCQYAADGDFCFSSEELEKIFVSYDSVCFCDFLFCRCIRRNSGNSQAVSDSGNRVGSRGLPLYPAAAVEEKTGVQPYRHCKASMAAEYGDAEGNGRYGQSPEGAADRKAGQYYRRKKRQKAFRRKLGEKERFLFDSLP